MKQKILFLCFIFSMGIFSQVYAQTIGVKSLSDFTTENPPAGISVELLEPLILSKDIELSAGTQISGNLTDVTSPKRMKRNASFSFEPSTYKDKTGNHKIDIKTKASYTVPLDKGQLAKSTAVTVGGFFVKGLGMGLAAVKGAVKNEEGNRIKSTVTSAYEASPVSYVEKGKDITIKVNDIFYLKFNNMNVEDENQNYQGGQNYTYTIEKE